MVKELAALEVAVNVLRAQPEQDRRALLVYLQILREQVDRLRLSL